MAAWGKLVSMTPGYPDYELVDDDVCFLETMKE